MEPASLTESLTLTFKVLWVISANFLPVLVVGVLALAGAEIYDRYFAK